MYREYALTLKWVWMCRVSKEFFFFFKKNACVWLCGEEDGMTTGFLSSSALRCAWNGKRECRCVTVDEWFWRERHCESCFFSLSLSLPPSSFSFVTIVRDRSRKSMLRNKSIWHIFFQLLDTLPVCQDFNRQVCNRPACKFIHLSDGEFSRSAATWRAALIPWLMESEAYISHSSHR